MMKRIFKIPHSQFMVHNYGKVVNFSFKCREKCYKAINLRGYQDTHIQH